LRRILRRLIQRTRQVLHTVAQFSTATGTFSSKSMTPSEHSRVFSRCPARAAQASLLAGAGVAADVEDDASAPNLRAALVTCRSEIDARRYRRGEAS
jgi:hypothetical protein